MILNVASRRVLWAFVLVFIFELRLNPAWTAVDENFLRASFAWC